MKRLSTLLFAGLAVAMTAATVPAAEYDRYERGYPPPPPSSPPPRAAYARPPQHAAFGQTYFFLHGGAFEPNDSSDGLAGYDSGGSFDLGFGSRVSPILAIEGTVGGFGADRGPDEVRVVPLTVGVRLILPNPILEPYVGGGVGFYFVDLKEPFNFGGIGTDDSDATAGGYLSLGLDAWLNPRVALNLEGKYHMATPTFTNNAGTSFDVDVSGWAVSLGVRLGF